MDQKSETETITKKKSPIIPMVVGVFALLVTGAVIAGILFYQKVAKPKRLIKEQFSLAEKYLSDLDYEKAILAYEEILLLDPKNPEAYIGILGAYDALTVDSIAKEDYDQATTYLNNEKDTLQRGIAYLSEAEAGRWNEKIKEHDEEIAAGQNKTDVIGETEQIGENQPEEKSDMASISYDYRMVDDILLQDEAGVLLWSWNTYGLEPVIDDTGRNYIGFYTTQYLNINGYLMPYNSMDILVGTETGDTNQLARMVHYFFDDFDNTQTNELVRALEESFGPATKSKNGYCWLTDDYYVVLTGYREFRHIELQISKD